MRRQHQLEVDAALLAHLPQREGQHVRPLGREHHAHRRLARHAYAGQAGQPPPPRRRRERPQRRAPQHHAVLLARQRVVEVDRRGQGRDHGCVEPGRDVRRDRVQRDRDAGHRERCHQRGVLGTRSRLPVTPRDGRSDRTRLSVGRADRRVSRATAAPSTSASKPIGLNTRSSNDPMPRAIAARHRRPPRHGVDGQRVGGVSADHVRRHVALLDRHVGPGAVVDDQASGATGRRPHRQPAELARPRWPPARAGRTAPRRGSRHPPAGRGRPSSAATPGGQRTRAPPRARPPRRRRSTYARRAAARPPSGRRGRRRRPARAGSARTSIATGGPPRRRPPARPRSRARPARRPGRGTRVRAPGVRQTSMRSHDGSRWTSGRSARGSQVLVTKSMTWTPGGASTRTSPGTSSPAALGDGGVDVPLTGLARRARPVERLSVGRRCSSGRTRRRRATSAPRTALRAPRSAGRCRGTRAPPTRRP